MSILFNGKDCNLIDHCAYIMNTYKNVSISDKEHQSYALNAKLFSIRNLRKQVFRKRTLNSDVIQEETLMIKQMYETFLKEIPADTKTDISNKYSISDTDAVRDLSKQLFESTVFDLNGMNGGNNSNHPLKCKINEDYFILPSNSRFFCGCVKEQCLKLEGRKFDLVVADPPWWNKFIRRLKSANDKLSYSMMYNEDIASIPMKTLFADNCLVAVWCTNAPNNVAAVKDIIFPEWNVHYVATWYWLKVTTDLEPVCGFNTGCKKQPYERLILGSVGDSVDIPDNQLIVSIPSALHSHKPPLLDLLAPYVKSENPQVLELFARYLLPNTTSVGYEPLKWQHLSLYEPVT